MAEDTRHAITLRMESLLFAALQEAARQQRVSLDQLVERYCAQGLASAGAPPLDSQVVLALRLLLEEIVERRVEHRLDAQANRLVTLILRAILRRHGLANGCDESHGGYPDRDVG